MSGPDYHAWTHRPKALGGTDPIDFPAGAKIITASATCTPRSRSLTGNAYTTMDFTTMWSNDASFGYEGATGSPVRAKYITISSPGIYMVQASIYNDEATPFTGTDAPAIEIQTFRPVANSTDLLINDRSDAGWDDGQSPIYGEMLTASEYAHQQMVQTVWFNFDAAWFGEDVIGLGTSVWCVNTVTLTIGGSIIVSRIGEEMTQTTVT